MEASISENKQLANLYRKKGAFDKAIPLYENLWHETADPFDGTGLLCCYRKMKLFDKAMPLAEELYKDHTDLTWAAREICWTFLQGKLQTFDESTPIKEIVEMADRVLQCSPDFLAKKLAVFHVLKYAKNKKDWDTIGNWIDRIESDKLSTKQVHFESGRESWSDLCLWHNYKISLFLEKEAFGKARKQAVIADEQCPKQRVFFLRLQAKALVGLGDIVSALRLYEDLCNKRRPEWWLLHEYGRLLKVEGNTDQALHVFCQAALSNREHEMMVKLFSDIAEILYERGDHEQAKAHFYLEKHIRSEKGWPISPSLLSKINTLDGKVVGNSTSLSKQEAFSLCQSFWEGICGSDKSRTQKKKKDLIGELTIPKNRLFCFVNTKDGLSAICFSKDIADDLGTGDTVIFDAIPSFDKKKNKESWKAIKVRKHDDKKNQI